MNRLPPNLHDAYKRERDKLPGDAELAGHITYTDVLIGYYLLVDHFSQPQAGEGMLAGLRDPNLLASALSRQTASFGGTPKWNDHNQILATMYFGLAKNHAFHDGNKRAALLMLLHGLRRNGRWIDCQQNEFESLTVAVAGSTLKQEYGPQYRRFENSPDPQVRFLADFIRRKTRKLDDEYRSLTFRDLKRTLSAHGHDLLEPSGNKIGVFRHMPGRKGILGIGKKKDRWVRLGSIGFPSWTKQVSKQDLRDVRELTGLTTKNGVDAKVFYEGNEPMFRLINDFEGPLRRLKDK